MRAAEGGVAPVGNVLLFCRQRNHDIMQSTQTLVDAKRLHSSDPFCSTFGYVFGARKIDNVPVYATSKTDEKRCSSAGAHILLLFEAPENLFLLRTDMEMMRCDRLECAFMLVAPETR